MVCVARTRAGLPGRPGGRRGLRGGPGRAGTARLAPPWAVWSTTSSTRDDGHVAMPDGGLASDRPVFPRFSRLRRLLLASSAPSATLREEPVRPSVGGMPQLPGTDLTVSDLCFGGNVFGWTADEATSFARARRASAGRRQLHRHRGRRTRRGDGNGRRVRADHRPLDGRARQPRPRRGGHQGRRRMHGARAVARRTSAAAAERSLRRLGVDTIDLYYAHYDDEDDAAGGDPGGLRRAGAGGQGAARRRVELLARSG